MNQPEQPAVMPPRVWLCPWQQVMSGKPSNSDVDVIEYLSKAESDALVKQAIADTWLKAARFCDFRELTSDIKPTFVAEYEAARGAV